MLYLLTHEDCGGCETAKEMFKDVIDNGKVKVINCDPNRNDEACDIIESLFIDKVPSLIKVEKHEEGYLVCDIDIVEKKSNSCAIYPRWFDEI